MCCVVVYAGELCMLITRLAIRVIRITCNVSFIVSTFPSAMYCGINFPLLLPNPPFRQLYYLWPSLDSAYISLVSNGRGRHTMRRHPQEEETAVHCPCQ